MKFLRFSVFGVLLFFLITTPAEAQTAKIAVGSYHSLVLAEDGKVYTFGSHPTGVLGQGEEHRFDTPLPMNHPNIAGKNIADISIYEGNGLILTDDGKVYGMGDASQYAFGPTLQATSNEYVPRLISETALDTAKIIDVEMGNNYSILLNEHGDVFVMGFNNNGYLGINSGVSPITSPTLIDQTNLTGEKIIKISTSGSHTLMLTESNKVFGFGSNLNGQLGDYTTVGRIIPIQIPQHPFDGKTIKDIVATQGVSTVLTTDGTVYRWGNYRATLGQGAISSDIIVPTPITHSSLEGKSIQSISGIKRSFEGIILVATDGSVYVAGQNYNGNLGKGDFVDTDTTWTKIPASYFDNKQIVEASVGSQFSLFKASDGTLFSAGKNGGNGYSGSTNKPLPLVSSNVDVSKVNKLIAVDNMGVLIDSTGSAYSFNNSVDPTLSFSTSSIRVRDRNGIKDTPTLLNHSNLSGHTIVDVKAGGLNSYLLTEEGKVFSFGTGRFGTLGTGDSLDVYVPTLISHSNLNGKKIIDIAVSWNRNTGSTGASHVLLLADDGSLFSMGSNDSGQLGLGDTQDRFVPTPVTTNLSEKTIVKIAANGKNSMAIASDGTVYLWGDGNNGEMGFGNTNDLHVPTAATHININGKGATDGAIGFTSGTDPGPHFLVVLEDSLLYSFGEGSDGGLGQGSKTDNYTPSKVVSTLFAGEKIKSVKAGYKNTSMILTESGKIYSWGNVWTVGFNTNPFTDYSSPTLVVSDDLNGRKIVDIAIFEGHSLALIDDGKVLSFGTISTFNNYGAFGNSHSNDGSIASDYPDQKLPKEIADFTTFKSPLPSGNLVLHLDAGRGLTTFGDSLNTWGDLGSSGNDGTQTILAQRPVVVDSAINNQQAIRFNGVNSYMVLPTPSTLGIQNSDYEVFIVAKTRTVNSNISFLMGGSPECYELHLNGTSGARFIPVASTYIDKGSVGDYSDSNAQLFNVRATDTQGIISVNRKETVTSTNAQSSDNGTLLLGVRSGGFFWLDGDIAEVIIYNSVLSPEDRGKVERYLFRKYKIQDYSQEQAKLTGSEGWRLMASPVADSTLSPLFANLWTQGFTGANVSHGSSSVYTWSTANATSDLSNWTALTDIANSPGAGSGALVYVFSDDNGPGVEGDAGFPKTLEIEGLEPSGDRELTSLLNTNIGGYTLLGNPFKKDVDWDAFTKTGLSNSVYVYDNNAAGWKSWNGTLGSLSDGEIGAFNGFFAQTTSADPTLFVPQAAKKDSARRFLGKQVVSATPTYFSLEFKSDSGFTNKAWFQFSETGEYGIDASDAYQLNPLSSKYVTLASALNDSTHLDINSLPVISEAYEVRLALQTTEAGGTHRISKSDFNLPEGWEITLHDSELEVSTDLSEPYVFTMASDKVKTQNIASPRYLASTQNPASPPSLESIFQPAKNKQAGARFTLTITPATTVNGEPVSDLPRVVELEQNYPNPFNPSSVIQFGVPELSKVRLEVFDILGRKVATLVNDEVTQPGRYSVQFHAGNLASGMYVYRLQIGNSILTKKMTLIK